MVHDRGGEPIGIDKCQIADQLSLPRLDPSLHMDFPPPFFHVLDGIAAKSARFLFRAWLVENINCQVMSSVQDLHLETLNLATGESISDLVI